MGRAGNSLASRASSSDLWFTSSESFTPRHLLCWHTDKRNMQRGTMVRIAGTCQGLIDGSASPTGGGFRIFDVETGVRHRYRGRVWVYPLKQVHGQYGILYAVEKCSRKRERDVGNWIFFGGGARTSLAPGGPIKEFPIADPWLANSESKQ